MTRRRREFRPDQHPSEFQQHQRGYRFTKIEDQFYINYAAALTQQGNLNDLGDIEYRIFMYLAIKADLRDGEWVAWPKQIRIAESCGCSRDTVNMNIDRLRRRKLLKVEYRIHDRSGAKLTVYIMLRPRWIRRKTRR